MTNDDQMQDVLGWTCEERYDYFLSEVAQERNIWILVNDDERFLKIHDEDDGTEYVPLWPRSEFAEAYAAKSGDLVPKSISVPEFFRKWIDGLTGDSLQIGVFPGLDSDIWLMTPSEFRNDLKEALSDI